LEKVILPVPIVRRESPIVSYRRSHLRSAVILVRTGIRLGQGTSLDHQFLGLLRQCGVLQDRGNLEVVARLQSSPLSNSRRIRNKNGRLCQGLDGLCARGSSKKNDAKLRAFCGTTSFAIGPFLRNSGWLCLKSHDSNHFFLGLLLRAAQNPSPIFFYQFAWAP